MEGGLTAMEQEIIALCLWASTIFCGIGNEDTHTIIVCTPTHMCSNDIRDICINMWLYIIYMLHGSRDNYWEM